MGCCGEHRQSGPPRKVASSAIVPPRRAACAQCDKLTKLGNAWFCGTPLVGGVLDPATCGCLLNIKWHLRGQKCPQSRWPA